MMNNLMMMTHHYSGYWSLCGKCLNPITLIQHKTVAPCNSKPNKYHKVLATTSMLQALCSYLKHMPVQHMPEPGLTLNVELNLTLQI